MDFLHLTFTISFGAANNYISIMAKNQIVSLYVVIISMKCFQGETAQSISNLSYVIVYICLCVLT